MLWYCLPVKTLRPQFPFILQTNSSPWGDGLREGWRQRDFGVCYGEAVIHPLSMPVFSQVAKTKVQTWNHHMASIHGLLQNQLPDSSQWLTVPQDSRLTVILLTQLKTDPFNASPWCNQRCVRSCLSAQLSKRGQPVDFEVCPHTSITTSVLTSLLQIYFSIIGVSNHTDFK